MAESLVGRAPTPGRLRGELPKLRAFLRRDVLVMMSYRTALVSDWVGLGIQITIFSFVSRMVDPDTLPTYGGSTVSYLQFVTVGIAVGAVIQLGLNRITTVVRQEQLAGTLEYLLTTPTRLPTLQLGSVCFDVLYVPARTVLFIVAVGVLFDVHFALPQLAPAMLVLAALLPVVWGIGVAFAAGVLTFRRGTGGVGMGAAILSVLSGAYFPLELLPAPVEHLARYNPVALALDGIRGALLGSAPVTDTLGAAALLLPMGAVAMIVGSAAFRAAVRREVRRGTLGLY